MMLPLSFDWTAVVTAISTLIAAAVGFVAGAYAARVQAQAQLEQLKWERSEAERQARQRVYLDFLNAANEIVTLTERRELITSDRFFVWLRTYTAKYNALLIAGHSEVSRFLTGFGPIQRTLFEQLRETFVEMKRSDESLHDEEAFDKAVRAAARRSQEQRRQGMHELINIMRSDVAPGGAPVYEVPARPLMPTGS